MKILLKIFLLVSVFSLITGCNNIDDDLEFDSIDNLEFDNASSSKNYSEKTVTMGFNLVFTGTYDEVTPGSPLCGSLPYMLYIINTGEGTGTHFGKVTSHFNFCVDARFGSYPNGFGESYFEDENGDRLFVNLEGFVLPGRVPGMPNFAVSYFKDPFTITGGTGRFKDATGSGWTNDYNSSKDDFSHHHWQGKITMKKGK